MLSNTATPVYYGKFRDAVLRGEIPVCKEIEMEMNRIDYLISDPQYFYDDEAIRGFIDFCEHEMTLTDGSDLYLLDTFKLWAESLLSWFYFEERKVPHPKTGEYRTKLVKKRLVVKQFLIVARGALLNLCMHL